MLRVILARIPQMVIVLIGVTLLAFFLVNVLPGNIIFVLLGDQYTPAAAHAITIELGLNHPLIIRYLDWLRGAAHLNFGLSMTNHVPVATEMRIDALPTIELVIGGQIIGTVLGCTAAILSVATRNAWIDRIVTGFALFCTSMPGFILALLVIAVFAVHWHIVSSIGWSDPALHGWGQNLRNIALPVILLGFGGYPGHMRIFRNELYDQMENEEYVTLAKMKGISTFRLMTRHVARNSAFGLITVIAVGTAGLIAGAVLLENIFAIPGIGALILTAISNRDATTLEGCITTVAFAIVLFNLFADLFYAVLDPRVRDAQNTRR